MNKVFKSPTVVIHDDREPLTIDQAFELLWDGKTVRWLGEVAEPEAK